MFGRSGTNQKPIGKLANTPLPVRNNEIIVKSQVILTGISSDRSTEGNVYQKVANLFTNQLQSQNSLQKQQMATCPTCPTSRSSELKTNPDSKFLQYSSQQLLNHQNIRRDNNGICTIERVTNNFNNTCNNSSSTNIMNDSNLSGNKDNGHQSAVNSSIISGNYSAKCKSATNIQYNLKDLQQERKNARQFGSSTQNLHMASCTDENSCLNAKDDRFNFNRQRELNKVSRQNSEEQNRKMCQNINELEGEWTKLKKSHNLDNRSFSPFCTSLNNSTVNNKAADSSFGQQQHRENEQDFRDQQNITDNTLMHDQSYEGGIKSCSQIMNSFQRGKTNGETSCNSFSMSKLIEMTPTRKQTDTTSTASIKKSQIINKSIPLSKINLDQMRTNSYSNRSNGEQINTYILKPNCSQYSSSNISAKSSLQNLSNSVNFDLQNTMDFHKNSSTQCNKPHQKSQHEQQKYQVNQNTLNNRGKSPISRNSSLDEFNNSKSSDSTFMKIQDKYSNVHKLKMKNMQISGTDNYIHQIQQNPENYKNISFHHQIPSVLTSGSKERPFVPNNLQHDYSTKTSEHSNSIQNRHTQFGNHQYGGQDDTLNAPKPHQNINKHLIQDKQFERGSVTIQQQQSSICNASEGQISQEQCAFINQQQLINQNHTSHSQQLDIANNVQAKPQFSEIFTFNSSANNYYQGNMNKPLNVINKPAQNPSQSSEIQYTNKNNNSLNENTLNLKKIDLNNSSASSCSLTCNFNGNDNFNNISNMINSSNNSKQIKLESFQTKQGFSNNQLNKSQQSIQGESLQNSNYNLGISSNSGVNTLPQMKTMTFLNQKTENSSTQLFNSDSLKDSTSIQKSTTGEFSDIPFHFQEEYTVQQNPPSLIVQVVRASPMKKMISDFKSHNHSPKQMQCIKGSNEANNSNQNSHTNNSDCIRQPQKAMTNIIMNKIKKMNIARISLNEEDAFFSETDAENIKNNNNNSQTNSFPELQSTKSSQLNKNQLNRGRDYLKSLKGQEIDHIQRKIQIQQQQVNEQNKFQFKQQQSEPYQIPNDQYPTNPEYAKNTSPRTYPSLIVQNSMGMNDQLQFNYNQPGECEKETEQASSIYNQQEYSKEGSNFNQCITDTDCYPQQNHHLVNSFSGPQPIESCFFSNSTQKSFVDVHKNFPQASLTQKRDSHHLGSLNKNSKTIQPNCLTTSKYSPGGKVSSHIIKKSQNQAPQIEVQQIQQYNQTLMQTSLSGQGLLKAQYVALNPYLSSQSQVIHQQTQQYQPTYHKPIQITGLKCIMDQELNSNNPKKIF